MGFVRRIFTSVYRYSRYFYPRQQVEITGETGLILFMDFPDPTGTIKFDWPAIE